jgi:hypothetical protein
MTSTSSRARQPRDRPLSDRRRLSAVALAVAALALTALPASATPADDYANTVLRTLTLVQFAEKGDQPSLVQAISAFGPIASSQPEISADLQRTPPGLQDADTRLTSLLDALRGRTDVADPQQAQGELHRILAMPRYAGLSAAPAWWQEVLTWLLTQIGRLLAMIGVGHLVIPPLAFLLAAGAVLLAIGVWLGRSLLSRVSGDRRRAAGAQLEARVDYFVLADRYADVGDYPAALRALAGGVATAVNGERVWASSPLTVREIFLRASSAQTLAPLLRSFEATVYGHRPCDAQAYAQAAAVAAPFRGVAA